MTQNLHPSEIEHRFGHHKATLEGPEATAPMHSELRRQYTSFANHLNEILPAGRYATLALTALEEAAMWSHKAVAEGGELTNDGPEMEGILKDAPEDVAGFQSIPTEIKDILGQVLGQIRNVIQTPCNDPSCPCQELKQDEAAGTPIDFGVGEVEETEDDVKQTGGISVNLSIFNYGPRD